MKESFITGIAKFTSAKKWGEGSKARKLLGFKKWSGGGLEFRHPEILLSPKDWLVDLTTV